MTLSSVLSLDAPSPVRPVLEVTTLIGDPRLLPGDIIVVSDDARLPVSVVRSLPVDVARLLHWLDVGDLRVARGDVAAVTDRMRRLAAESGLLPALRRLR